MKTANRFLVGAGSLVLAGIAMAGDPGTPPPLAAPAPAPQPAVASAPTVLSADMLQWRRQMVDIEQGLFVVRQRLGLAGRDAKGFKDPEVAGLYETAEKARKALEDKTRELLKADTEGATLLAQVDDLQKKALELQQQQRDLDRKLMAATQRMGLQLAGTNRTDASAASAAPTDPAFAALREAAEKARKALDDKFMERIKADPDGARLLQQREDLMAKVQAARAKATDRPSAHQP